MSKIIGIDLGTSNCRVAVMEGGKPVMISDGSGSAKMPSAVVFTGDGDCLVGREAVNRAGAGLYPTAVSGKRELGAGNKTAAGGKAYPPEYVIALLFRRLKETAEAYLGERVWQAVVSVPASFSNIQRQAVMDAGRIAGLEVLRVIVETTAAALAYGLNREDQQKILVYNLGAGYCDVTVADIGDGVFEVLSTAGASGVGGDAFDRLIAEDLADRFRKETGIDLKQDRIASRRLKEAAEKAKTELSDAEATRIFLPSVAADASGPKHLDLTLTRTRFNELTGSLVSAATEPVLKALEDAGPLAKPLHSVILIGGSTRIPAVQEAVRKVTGREPFRGIDRDSAAAMGAAILAGTLAGEVKDIILLDATQMSLGIETEGRVFTKLIARNTSIPTSLTQSFSTAADNQNLVEIHVLQGERRMACDNASLGRLRLTGIAPAPRGVPQIDVTFSIDNNGILNVSAKDRGTGREQQITITGGSNLSKEEVARWAAEQEQYAEKRKRLLEEKETLNQADSLIHETEKTLREQGCRLSDEDRNNVLAAVTAFRKVRESGNAAAIRTAMEDYTRKVYAIFSRLYLPDPPAEKVSTEKDTKENTGEKEIRVRPAESPMDVAERMLPVLDDLERAVQAAASSSDPALKDGIEKIQKKMQDIYRSLGFTEINRPGLPFDPRLEHAVGTEHVMHGKPGTVYRVVQKGYLFGGRVFRFAQVIVIPE